MSNLCKPVLNSVSVPVKPVAAGILLIDDDEFIREIVASTFESSPGFSIMHAQTATGGLESVRENSPDLIIMDLGLPDMNGLDLLKILKTEKESREIPIVVLSGTDNPQVRVQVYRLGAAWFLEKPFRPHLLRDLVTDLISVTT